MSENSSPSYKNDARAARGEPVAYVVRAFSDGSIGSVIAPVNYLLHEKALVHYPASEYTKSAANRQGNDS